MPVPGSIPPPDEHRNRQFRAWSAGLDVFAGLAGMGLVGWLLDRWLGTAPWWMLGLGLAGMAGGFYNFFRAAMAINRESSRQFRRDHPPGSVKPLDPDSRDAGQNAEKGESPPSPER